MPINMEIKTTVLPLLAGFAGLLKKYSMYPIGHPAIDNALDQLAIKFKNYFQYNHSLSIGIGKNRLFIENEEFFGDEWMNILCETLHAHSVSMITFQNTLVVNELIAFCETLKSDPLMARESGGYRKILERQGMTSIQIVEIDYNLEEGDIERQLATLSDAKIWQRIAQGWGMRRAQSDSEEQEFMRQLLENAPRLAVILDSAISGSAKIEESEEAAAVFFYMLASMIPNQSTAGPDDIEAFKNQIIRLLNHISPRSRFILMQKGVIDETLATSEVAFILNNLHELNDTEIARSMFEGLAPGISNIQDYAKTYLYYVSSQRETEVLSEIETIVGDRDLRYDTQFASMVQRAGRLPDNRPALVRLKKTIIGVHEEFINREIPVYEYVETMYKDISDLVSSLADTKVEEAACANILRVLDLTQSSDNYIFYAQGLDELILTLIETGQYQLAEKSVKVLRRHAGKKNESPHSRKMAISILKSLRKPELAESLLKAMQDWGKREGQTIGTLLLALGPAAHEPTLLALTSEKNRAIRATMIEVLAKAGPDIQPKIKNNLLHKDWFVVRNMISLLSRIQPIDLVDSLTKVLHHPEPRVRKEAARGLAMSLDPMAVYPLKDLILDPDPGVRQQAILSLGRFKNSDEAAKVLLTHLSKKNPFNGDQKSEILAIQALGLIRAKSAMHILSRYVAAPKFLGGYNDDMCIAACRAIAAIDDPMGIRLLKKGTKSWSKAVRAECKYLLSE